MCANGATIENRRLNYYCAFSCANCILLNSAFNLEQLQTKQVATYPSNELTYTLDYIFYNSERIEFIESQVLKETKTASDHIPIMMKFRLR